MKPFTQCMQNTLEALAAGENLTVCSGSDDLCAACPHRRENNGCALGTEDVFRRDQAALAAVGVLSGQEMKITQAGQRLRRVEKDQWLSVCGGCRWQKEGLCSWSSSKNSVLERFVEFFGKEGSFPEKNGNCLLVLFENSLAFRNRIY